MNKNERLIKGCIMSFSQEKRIKNNIIDKNLIYQLNKNLKKYSNSNFNKSNSNRAQNYRLYEKKEKPDITNRLNIPDHINKNFILKSQKIEKPVTVQKEHNQTNRILPLLNDKTNYINNSIIISKKNLLNNASSDLLKITKLKTVKRVNKSHFSMEKKTIKDQSPNKYITNLNSTKDLINSSKNTEQYQNYLKTLITKTNTNSHTKTSVNKEKNDSVISTSRHHIISKKRGTSSYSMHLVKKKKIKIKNRGKIYVNKSSSNIGQSFTDLQKNLINQEKDKCKDINNKNNLNKINMNNINNYDNMTYSNRVKIYDYYITKYRYNNQDLKNINTEDNENNNNNNSSNINQSQQNKMFFYIYHFFKSNNLFFFIPNSKYDQIKETLIKNNNISSSNEINNRNKLNILSNLHNSQKEGKNYEIIEDLYLPPAFRPRMNRWPNMPECIIDTCKNGGFALIKNFDNCNLIWKLTNPNRMKSILRNIHNNQKYNHYISTFQLGRKDNLYKNFKYYKRLFPDLFNYVPATYILPNDAPEFDNEFRKNKKALWIVKPVNLSRGRGIHLLRGESEYKYLYKRSTQISSPQYLISKYIDKPHLLNNKKYDLRIYVLVASFTPLRIYLYNNGLVRFATEDYNKKDLNNVFIHLTNYSINKKNLKYKSNNNLKEQQCEIFPREETEGTEAEAGIEGDTGMEEGEENGDENIPDDDSNKWSFIEYRNYFKKIGKGHIMDLIWNQIEAIVIKTIISVSKEYYKNIFPSKINNSFELYGFDVLIDKNFRAWLLEVNVNPSLHCTSPLDLSIKTDLISDIFNVVGVLPYNHNGNRSVFNYTMIKKKKEDNSSLSNKVLEKKEKKSKIDKKDLNKLTKTERDDINNKMSIKCNILRNYDSEKLEKKLPEYDEEHYKKIIEIYSEEKSRSHATEFSLLFPLKSNIKLYGKILIKDNAINDYNIVLWQHILTH